MSVGAALFLALSWAFVLGLMGWSYGRVLRPRPKAAPDAARPPHRNGRA